MPGTCNKSRIHTGEIPYPYDYYNKRCTTKSNLSQNLGTHSSEYSSKVTY